MARNGKLPPTQQRMLKLFSDGLCHSKEELRTCLFDEQGDLHNVHWHLHHLRKYLEPKGQTISCIYRNRRIYYCHTVKLTPAHLD